MASVTGNRGFWTALALLFCVIALQAFAISGDKPSFDRPVLSMAASFHTAAPPAEAGSPASPASEPDAAASPAQAESSPSSTSVQAPATPEPVPARPDALPGSPVTAVAPAPAPIAPLPPPADPLGPTTYVVRPGDSLWLIARRLGVPLERIVQLNALPSHTIQPGQVLVMRTETGAAPVASDSARAPEIAPAARPTPAVAPAPSAAASAATPSPPASAASGLTYRVQPGDTLHQIAERFNVSVTDLMLENGIEDTRSLRVGRVLSLKPPRTISHRVCAGETLWTIAKRYGITLQKLLEENPLNRLTIRPGQSLEIPVLRRPSPRAMRQLNRSLQSAVSLQWAWPITNRRRITDGYGMRIHPILQKRMFHCGVDVACSVGTPVRASLPGIVTFAGWLRGYGRTVVIKHKNGFTTRYAHLSRIRSSVGQFLSQGQSVGLSGNSGTSTGPHLHYEVRYEGRHLDPCTVFKDVG